MKIKQILSLVLFSFFFVINLSGALLAPSDSFRFEATLKSGESVVSGMVINVYLDGKKVQSKNANRQGNFSIYFKHNKLYTLEFIKKNYIIEKVVIDSKISDQLLKSSGIEIAFDNDIPVFEYYDGVKVDIFNAPVLFYVYNEKNSFFEQDRKRSKSSQLTSISSKITATRNKQANEALKAGNTLFSKQKYEEALIAFNAVVEISPSNEVALGKIKEIGKLLKSDPGKLDASYKQYVADADNALSAKKYKEATDNYKKAKALKPEQVYPANKIFYIDSLVSQLYNQNKGEYDKFKGSGDQKYKDKKYEEALDDYESALALLPEEPIVTKLVKAAKAAIEADKKKKEDEKKALQDQLNVLLKKATDYSSKKDFANAVAMYNQASQLDPSNTEVSALKEKATKALADLALAKLKAQKEKNYNDTVALANDAFGKKDYDSAKSLFLIAQNILPDEKLPAQKIKEIDRLLKALEKKSNTNSEANASANDTSKVVEVSLMGNKKQEVSKEENLKSLATDYQLKSDFKNALISLQQALKLAKTSGDKNEQAVVLSQIASVYYDSGQYKLTIHSFQDAIELKKELGDAAGEAGLYSDMGLTYSNIYQFESATEALNSSLSIYKKINNKLAITETCNLLANVYYNQNNYSTSASYYKMAITEATQIGDLQLQSKLINSLGVTYYKMGKFNEAVKCYQQAATIDEQTGNKKNLSLTYNNLGNVNFDWNKYESAISYYEKSLSLKKSLNFEEGVAVSLLNIGNAYLELKKLPQAMEFLSSGLKMALKLNFRDVKIQAYRSMARLYEEQKDYPNAMAAMKAISAMNAAYSLPSGQLSETSNMYESESKTIRQLRKELSQQKIFAENEALQNKQKEQQLVVKDLQIEDQKSKATRSLMFLIIALLVALSAGFIAFMFYKRYKEKKQYSEVIGFQNRQITDSIEYAGRIQRAVLPPVDYVQTIFPNSFLLNMPKDIVSGDFYYITVVQNKTYLAVADCTGHGVPGAFMSMLGMSLSKEVVQMQNTELGANEILNLMRDSLMKSLHQTGKDEEAKDGMDIALCIIDSQNMRLEYSGANNPCYVIRNSELIELKPDRMPIGIHPVLKPFSSQHFDLHKDDLIYLFSDGYRDQIGGDSLKKFKKEQFNKLLLEISSLNMNDQVNRLREGHLQWKSDMEQTDDILVMGIRV